MPEIAIMTDPVSSADISTAFDSLRGPLQRYFRIHGLGREDAEEAVQETFLRLHRHLAQNGPQTTLRGWIFEVARNLALNEFKSARRRRTEALDDRADAHRAAGREKTPEQQAIHNQRMQRLDAAIGRLSVQQRECVRLRASGLKYREIAEVLGIGTSSVGELMERALSQLSEEDL